jgi:hypothetical protein
MELEPNLGVALDFAKLSLGLRQTLCLLSNRLAYSKSDQGLATGCHVPQQEWGQQ